MSQDASYSTQSSSTASTALLSSDSSPSNSQQQQQQQHSAVAPDVPSNNSQFDTLLSAAYTMSDPATQVTQASQDAKQPEVHFAQAITFDTSAAVLPDGLLAQPYIPSFPQDACTPHVCFRSTAITDSPLLQTNACLQPDSIPVIVFDAKSRGLSFDTRVNIAKWIKTLPDVFTQTVTCQRLIEVCRHHIDATYPRKQAVQFTDCVAFHWFDLDRVLDWLAGTTTTTPTPTPTSSAATDAGIMSLRSAFHNAVFSDQAPLINVLFEPRNLGGRMIKSVTPYVFLCIVVPIVAQLQTFPEAHSRALIVSAAADYVLGCSDRLTSLFARRMMWFITRFDADSHWLRVEAARGHYTQKVAQLEQELAEAKQQQQQQQRGQEDSKSAHVSVLEAAQADAAMNKPDAASMLPPLLIGDAIANDKSTAAIFESQVPPSLIEDIRANPSSALESRREWLRFVSNRPISRTTSSVDDYKFQLERAIARANASSRAQTMETLPAADITQSQIDKWVAACQASQLAIEAYKQALILSKDIEERWVGSRTDVLQNGMIEGALANAATAVDIANALTPCIEAIESPFAVIPLFKNPDLDELEALQYGVAPSTHASMDIPTMGAPRATALTRCINTRARKQRDARHKAEQQASSTATSAPAASTAMNTATATTTTTSSRRRKPATRKSKPRSTPQVTPTAVVTAVPSNALNDANQQMPPPPSQPVSREEQQQVPRQSTKRGATLMMAARAPGRPVAALAALVAATSASSSSTTADATTSATTTATTSNGTPTRASKRLKSAGASRD